MLKKLAIAFILASATLSVSPLLPADAKPTSKTKTARAVPPNLPSRYRTQTTRRATTGTAAAVIQRRAAQQRQLPSPRSQVTKSWRHWKKVTAARNTAVGPQNAVKRGQSRTVNFLAPGQKRQIPVISNARPIPPSTQQPPAPVSGRVARRINMTRPNPTVLANQLSPRVQVAAPAPRSQRGTSRWARFKSMVSRKSSSN